jgi:hypothetical protein
VINIYLEQYLEMKVIALIINLSREKQDIVMEKIIMIIISEIKELVYKDMEAKNVEKNCMMKI